MHIATEVLETGLCFMIKVWLVTLIGLTNSLSTFQLLRDDKKTCMYSAVNSLMSNNGEFSFLLLFILLNQSAHVHVWSA